MNGATYTLDGEPLDFDDFLAVNAETFDSDDIEAACALEPGQSVNFGGGALATSVLARVS